MSAPRTCPRTLAVYRPGEAIPGVHCWYDYTGSMPCTGRLLCTLCGQEPPAPDFDPTDFLPVQDLGVEEVDW